MAESVVLLVVTSELAVLLPSKDTSNVSTASNTPTEFGPVLVSPSNIPRVTVFV
jgi:hypothetical protein